MKVMKVIDNGEVIASITCGPKGIVFTGETLSERAFIASDGPHELITVHSQLQMIFKYNDLVVEVEK